MYVGDTTWKILNFKCNLDVVATGDKFNVDYTEYT